MRDHEHVNPVMSPSPGSCHIEQQPGERLDFGTRSAHAWCFAERGRAPAAARGPAGSRQVDSSRLIKGTLGSKIPLLSESASLHKRWLHRFSSMHPNTGHNLCRRVGFRLRYAQPTQQLAMHSVVLNIIYKPDIMSKPSKLLSSSCMQFLHAVPTCGRFHLYANEKNE